MIKRNSVINKYILLAVGVVAIVTSSIVHSLIPVEPTGNILGDMTPTEIPEPSDPPDPFSISLYKRQQRELRRLYKSDAQVRKLIDQKISLANKYLSQKPNPIELVQVEGRLPSDPVLVKSSNSLQDATKIYELSIAYSVTRNTKYSDKAKEFLLAWVRVNKPNGNPIDSTPLQGLVEGYDLIMDQLSADEQVEVNTWLFGLADSLISFKFQGNTYKNNWNSHRLKIIGLIGFSLNNSTYIDYATENYKKQVQMNLYSDGSSYDFKERNSMGYHCYDIEALLVLARAAAMNNIDLYNFEASSGASLKKSVAFLEPYAKGEKKNNEYVGSKIAIDLKRAQTGSKEFAIGKEFDPQRALYPMEVASYFDERYLTIVRSMKKTTEKYPTFYSLVSRLDAGAK